MDQSTDLPLPPQLARLNLDDAELAYAATYVQAVESLSTMRFRTLAHTLHILLGVFLFSRLCAALPPRYETLRQVVDAVGLIAPCAYALGLLFTLLAGRHLDRQLAATTLSEDAQSYLRRIASNMDIYVLKRFWRRIAALLRCGP